MQLSHVQIVQDTFALVTPQADTVAKSFYSNLFHLDSSLQPMFRGDMLEQGRKLMTALSLVVSGLREPERILPALRSLGARHVSYGVTAAQYETVGRALLMTLEQGLGNRFDDDAREAWSAAYALVATQMIAAAKSAGSPEREAHAE